MANRFERALQAVRDAEMRDALARVLDTAEVCKAWFESRGLTPTPADLIAISRMVLEQAARGTIQTALDDDHG